jgi:hypothetical protein
MSDNRFRTIIKFAFASGDPVLGLLDPFDIVAPRNAPDKRERTFALLGFVPAMLNPIEGKTWAESIAANYREIVGGPAFEMKGVKLRGYAWTGDAEDGEPDLYPIAIFENLTTGERVAYYQYQLTAVLSRSNELIYATRLD